MNHCRLVLCVVAVSPHRCPAAPTPLAAETSLPCGTCQAPIARVRVHLFLDSFFFCSLACPSFFWPGPHCRGLCCFRVRLPRGSCVSSAFVLLCLPLLELHQRTSLRVPLARPALNTPSPPTGVTWPTGTSLGEGRGGSTLKSRGRRMDTCAFESWGKAGLPRKQVGKPLG